MSAGTLEQLNELGGLGALVVDIAAGDRALDAMGHKRELKCACVGGSSNVPPGLVSLTENVAMVAMALWMLARPH